MVRQKTRGEGNGEREKEDVETKKGKNIVVGGGRDYSNDSPLVPSLPSSPFSLTATTSTPSLPHTHGSEEGFESEQLPPSFSYEELMRSSGAANSKCRRSTFAATAEGRKLPVGVLVCVVDRDDVEYPFIGAVKRPLRGRPTYAASLPAAGPGVADSDPIVSGRKIGLINL